MLEYICLWERKRKRNEIITSQWKRVVVVVAMTEGKGGACRNFGCIVPVECGGGKRRRKCGCEIHVSPFRGGEWAVWDYNYKPDTLRNKSLSFFMLSFLDKVGPSILKYKSTLHFKNYSINLYNVIFKLIQAVGGNTSPSLRSTHNMDQ